MFGDHNERLLVQSGKTDHFPHLTVALFELITMLNCFIEKYKRESFFKVMQDDNIKDLCNKAVNLKT